MAEERGKCKYHSKEHPAFCKFTNRPCFGAYYDEFKGDYVIDIWKEQKCPTYKFDDKLYWSKETAVASINLKDIFEQQKKESLKLAEAQEIAGEVEANESGVVEIVLFGMKIPVENLESADEVPESIDIDAEVLQHYFNRKYGPGLVKVKWVDVLSPDLEDYPEVYKYVTEHETYPIVMINGTIKFVGSISVDLINKELQKLGLKPVEIE